MRKKTHISVARYLVSELGDLEVGLQEHKKAFYLGSILPDCKPSFLTTKHEIEGTYDMFCANLHKLFLKYNLEEFNARAFYRNLGELIHYLADYFTFPHNAIYDGSLKDHCVYEKHLKIAMKEYLNSGEVEDNIVKARSICSLDELTSVVWKVHGEYLKVKHSVEEDCRYIVAMCHMFVISVIQLFFTTVNLVVA